MKEESEKASLKLNIQKTKIKASGPITSCQTDGGKVETVIDFPPIYLTWSNGTRCLDLSFLKIQNPKSLQMVTAATKLKDACSLEEMLWQI